MDWAPTVGAALAAALLLGTLARRLGQSPLVGFLLAGVLIGPNTPGFVGDGVLAGHLADVGVVLLMFGVGLGFSFDDLLTVRRLALPGALLASGTVVLLGTGLGLLLGWPAGGAAVLGMCLATASTVVIARAMTELGLLAAAPGHIAIGWSLVEDLVTVVLLVVLPALAPGESTAPQLLWRSLGESIGRVAVLAAVVVWGGGHVVPRFLSWVARAQSRELFTLAVLTVALGVAFLAAELFGVSLALGAFLAGMVVGRSDLAHQAAADALPMRDAFAVLFFVAVGMLFDPGFVLRAPLLVLGALLVVLIAKPAVAVLFLLARGEAPRTALAVGAGLAQVSEFSFVLAGLATMLGVLPPGGRDLVLATALASLLLNPLLFRALPWVDRWLSAHPAFVRRRARRERDLGELRPAQAGGLDRHVVIVGYGRVGSVLGELLRARGETFVVIEVDRVLVERLRRADVAALYGDASNPLLLDRAGIDRARAIALTAPDPVMQRLALEHARSRAPGIEVLVRVHNQQQLDEMLAIERVRPVHGERELGLAMGRQLLEALGASPIEAEAAVLGMQRSDQGPDNPPRLFELPVPPETGLAGRTLADLQLPPAALIVAVVRGGRHLVPRGPTALATGDILLVFASGDDARLVEHRIAAIARPEAAP